MTYLGQALDWIKRPGDRVYRRDTRRNSNLWLGRHRIKETKPMMLSQSSGQGPPSHRRRWETWNGIR
jgi:hypothetical protein